VSGHGGSEYEMLLDDANVVAQIHQWDADEHPHLGNHSDPSRGNGVVLWFATEDVDAIVQRVEQHGAQVLDGPLVNPNSRQRELWLRGPEGYVVAVSGP